MHTYITGLGIFLLISYGLMKVFEFYGISINAYGSYLSFYLFLLITAFILPRNYKMYVSN